MVPERGARSGRPAVSPRAVRIARTSALGAAAVAASGVAALLYGVVIERLRFRLDRVEAPVLAPGSKPIRVLHLSDFHLAPWQTIKQDFVRGLAELEPDLIVDTGDNLGHAEVLPQLRAMLAPFRGVPGVFVHGSNDYYGPVAKNPFTYFDRSRKIKVRAPKIDVQGLERLLTDELGWHSLNNAATTLDVDGQRLRFVGVNDPHIKYDRLDEAREALAAQPAEGTVGTVGLAHAPYRRVLDELTDLGADAIFAGHTHGGQVCVPLYGALVTNCDVPRDQVSGPSTWTTVARDAFLHVSRGLGTSIYAPVRFACPPAATLVTLTAR